MRRSCAMPAFASQRQRRRLAPGQGQLAVEDAGAARRIALAPERSGGVQVEGGQTGIAAFFLASEEKAAAVGEGQQVANRCPVPATLRDPLGEQAVEQVAAPGGKEARTQVAVRRQQVLFRATARVDQVAAAVAEALQAEIVGHAVRGDTFQARVEKGTPARSPVRRRVKPLAACAPRCNLRE